MKLIEGNHGLTRQPFTERFLASREEVDAVTEFNSLDDAIAGVKYQAGSTLRTLQLAGLFKAMSGELHPGAILDLRAELLTLAHVARRVAECQGLFDAGAAREGLDPTRVRVSLDDDGVHDWEFESREGGGTFYATYPEQRLFWEVTGRDVFDVMDAIADHAYSDEHPADTVKRLAAAAGSVGIVHPEPEDVPTSEDDGDGLDDLLDGLEDEEDTPTIREVAFDPACGEPGCCPDQSRCPVGPAVTGEFLRGAEVEMHTGLGQTITGKFVPQAAPDPRPTVAEAASIFGRFFNALRRKGA